MREVVVHCVLVVTCLLGASAASRRDRRAGFATVFALGALLVPALGAGWTFPGGAPGFASMRLLAGILFVELPLTLVALAFHAPRAWRARRAASLLVACGLVAVAVDVFLIEPRALVVRHETIHSPRIGRRLRVVVLSDVQTDSPGEYESRVMRRANALRPDLVLLPGDYIQLPPGPGYERAAARLGRMFDSLVAPLGTFAVRGNVEHAGFVEDVFGSTHVRAFDETTRIPVGEIELVALSFDDSFDARLELPRSDRFQIAFGHGPDFMLGDVEADLAIAGHTHGGQVRIPFFGPPLTLSSVPRAWAAGAHVERSGGRHLVISRGIGMERDAAPRFRFNCRPEIVVIDLVPEARPPER